MIILTLVATTCVDFSLADGDDDNSLSCMVKYLTERGINEDFFSSVDQKTKPDVSCDNLINAKLTKAYGKIEDKLKADTFFIKYTPCIMQNIKTEANKLIILQRESIKINGLGIKVWNYFDQREHLDELKKKIETSINKAANEKCITVY